MTRFGVTSFFLLALALLFAPVRGAHAAEAYDNCAGFITSLPATISTQGTWCLKGDLNTTITGGVAITINTNNVTLDCNNYKLGGLAAGLGTGAYGIYEASRLNVTVRHCNIRGFKIGLAFVEGGGHVIEDNIFQSNTYIGAYVTGPNSVIRRNQIIDTGSSTANAEAYGVYTEGPMDLVDNTFAGINATVGTNGFVVGIYTAGNAGGRIAGNGIRGLAKDGTGSNYAFYSTSDTRLNIRNNDIIGDGSAGFGLLCGSATSHAKDNVVNGFVTPMSSCSDNGGNVLSP